MAQITGGTVSVEDGLKKQEEYAPPRKVRVDLTFAVAEGEDFSHIFDLASEAATNRVAALLNGVSLRAVTGLGPTFGETPASPQPEAPAAPKTRTRRTAAQIAADNAAKNAGGASPSGSGGGAPTSDDPAAIEEDPTGGEEHVIALPDETGDDSFDIEAPSEESFDIEPEPDAGAAPITDADLNSAVQKKNAEIANPNAIRELIGSYNPDPKAAFQLRQIDPAKRAEFIAKLGKLTKAA